MWLRNFLLLSLFALPAVSISQHITYSEPDREDARSVDFEIIGKVSGNFLVYKNIRSKYMVSVYDNDMNLKDKVDLDFMPDKIINADFIAYPEFAYIIYQFQKRSIIHCMAVKIDGNGKNVGNPVELDTTHIGFFAVNKIYNMVNSEDRKKIMIYKIQKKYDKFDFATVLYNSDLVLLHRSRLQYDYDEHRDAYSDFFVDNDGEFLFTKSEKTSNREAVTKLTLVTKAPQSDDFHEFELPLNGHFLDETIVKVDNVNRRYVLNAFYYKQRHGNIEGLYSLIWDKESGKPLIQRMTEFNDTLKHQAKTDGSYKAAFNNFFIRQVILKRDGAFILAAEDFNSQSRSSPWNRMDYLYGYPYLSTYDYYLNSPSSAYWYYRTRNFNNTTNQTRYFYNNIVVFDVDKEGKLEWGNVIHKQQYDDNDDNFLSYQIMNAGGELHFLFNEVERRNQLISDQSITADGKLIRNPTLKSLDRGFDFMPKYAKQVSAKQIIVPCMYRNYLCFAKIDY